MNTRRASCDCLASSTRIAATRNKGQCIEPQVTHKPTTRTFATIRRGFQEFLRLPVIIIAVFLVLSVATYLLDNANVGWLQPSRQFMSDHVFGDPESTGQLLGAIAGSLITVASITFSLLLLAVQQAAGAMTHSVIDQFLRRRVNQVFFGFFVGLAINALITLATVDPPFNPVFGATNVLTLAIVAIIMLLFLIYLTVHQMRPAIIIQSIHDLTLAARKQQLALIAASRADHQGSFAVTLPVTSAESGYLVHIDHERIIGMTTDAGDNYEAEFVNPIGAYVAFGDTIAVIRAADRETAKQVGEAVASAIRIESDQSLEMDPAHGIEQLVTIAWTSISTSKQNPAPGLTVNYALRDILARLAADGYDVERDPTSPLVYHDTLLDELFQAFELLAVVSTESMQPQQFAVVAETFTQMYGRIPAEWQARMETAIVHILPGLGDHMLTVRLDRSLGGLIATLQQHGRHDVAAAVNEAQRGMRATIGVLNSRATRVPPG